MNDKNAVTNVTNRIDWSLVITLVATALTIAGLAYGLKKSGIKVAKDIGSSIA